MCYTRSDFIVKVYDYVKRISKVSMGGGKAGQEASKKCVNQFSNNNQKSVK